MKQKVLYCFLLIIIVANGCSSGNHTNYQSSDVREININPNTRNIGKLTLSEIVESILYIPLETNDNCLIGEISKSIFSENYVLLYCNVTKRCFLFSRTGRFIAQIGDVGGGPGEYVYLANLLRIDEKNNQIVIHCIVPNQLLYYDLEGRFIKSEHIENAAHNADAAHFNEGSKIMSYQNGFYLLKTTNNGNTPYSYTIMDDDFNIITKKVTPIPFTMKQPNTLVAGGSFFCQYSYDNQVHVRENMLNDTLYKINHDFSFIPKYIVNAGKYKMTLEIRSDANAFVREARNILTMMSMFETKDYLLLSYMIFDEFRVPCYYQKKEDKLFYFSSTSGIPNDYDGGLDFWPKYQSENQLITFYYAYQIEEYESNPNKMKPQGSSEAVYNFEQMSRKLDSENNPVMVVVTLK